MGTVARCEEPVHRRWQFVRHLRWREPDIHDPGPGALHRRSDEAAPGQPVRLKQAMPTDNPLTPTQSDDLRAIAGVIIPASAEFDVPGADDPAIQADVVATLGRDARLVREALDEFARLAGSPLAGLDPARREAVAVELRAKGGAAVVTLTRVVLQCYYRDDRVVRPLGLEPPPPQPKSHAREDGDWTLLDPVRARAPPWRCA